MKNCLLLALILFVSTVVNAQKYQPVAQKAPAKQYGTGLFNSAEGTVFDLENESNNTAVAYFNILDWLQGQVAGLQVYTMRNGNRVAFIRNMPATVFVDEVRIDFSFLNMLPVSDIAAVKIIKQPFALGAPGGVIAIYTKDGEETEEENI